MNLNILKDAISSAVSESYIKQYSRSEWTKCIKRRIVESAKIEGLYSCCAGVGIADWGEWLYDLVILKYYENNSDNHIASTELVLESEWDTDDLSIIVDFQKLLVSNAKIKIMIYYKNEKEVEVIKSAIDRYEQSNGIFLIAFISKSDESKVEYFEIQGKKT